MPHCCLGRWEWASGSYVSVPFDDLQLPRIKLATSKKKKQKKPNAHVGYFFPFVKDTEMEGRLGGSAKRPTLHLRSWSHGS